MVNMVHCIYTETFQLTLQHLTSRRLLLCFTDWYCTIWRKTDFLLGSPALRSNRLNQLDPAQIKVNNLYCTILFNQHQHKELTNRRPTDHTKAQAPDDKRFHWLQTCYCPMSKGSEELPWPNKQRMCEDGQRAGQRQFSGNLSFAFPRKFCLGIEMSHTT